MKTHETQKVTADEEKGDHNVLPMIEEAQRIEGGGPPRKIAMKSLPKPIRMFGYCMLAVFLILILLLFISDFLK